MIVGAIDVGTNSVKLLAARAKNGRLRMLARRSVITRLGRGLNDTGLIGRVAADHTIEALADFKRTCELLKCDHVVAVGTEALRRAKNGPAFVRLCRKETGLPLRVIGPAKESRLSFLGATLDWPGRLLAILDVGGGSTEFVVGSDGRSRYAKSLPLGCVTITEAFLKSDPPAQAERERATEAIRRAISRLPSRAGADLVGVGGAAITAAAVLRKRRSRLHGTILRLSEIEALLEDLAGMKLAVRRRVPCLEPDRADIMPAGLMIVVETMRKLGAERMLISRHGLRRGLILEAIGR